MEPRRDNKRVFIYNPQNGLRITKTKSVEEILMKQIQSSLAELVIIKQITEN